MCRASNALLAKTDRAATSARPGKSFEASNQ
jgi:hypothetical protein